jgi:DNA-binding LytR/AlgR family response regulator
VEAPSQRHTEAKQPESTDTVESNTAKPVEASTDKESTFLLSLPGIVGTDIVAVSSDLHYLNVWTVAGRTTVLGNLRDAVAELDEIGMQVHRSHWVAHAHVRRIVGTATDAACILSNELRVPISRRKWKAVREHYGRNFVQR